MRRFVWLVVLTAVLVPPGRGLAASVCVESVIMEDYLTRHVTMWYLGEDEFIRIEDGFRDSTEPLVGRYGPENDFLEIRIEEVYGLVSDTIGIDPAGLRVEVEFVSNSDSEESRADRAVGDWFDEVGAGYDQRSNTVFLDSSRPGPATLAAGLTIALLYHEYDFTPPGAMVRSALETVGDVFSENNIWIDFVN